MKRILVLILSVFCTNTVAEENHAYTLNQAFSQGRFKGLIRYSGQHRDSNLHTLQDSSTTVTTDEKKQQYSAIGGYLGYETAPLFNVSLGATVYTSQPVGNNPADRKGLGGLYEENGKQESYTVLGEAFIQYEKERQLVRAGRQEMPDYRFVSLSDVRMTPITHQGIAYENTELANIKFNLAYISRMKERNAEDFIDMARGARLTESSSSGKPLIHGDYDSSDYVDGEYGGDKKAMSMASLIYETEQFSAEIWNYYVNDFVNTPYLYGLYDVTPENSPLALRLSAQYASQSDVGGDIAGNVDTWFYGVKIQAATRNTSFFLGYNEVNYNEASYDGGTLFVRWGTPQMFNSFQVQDSELAGTKSYGTGFQYKFDHNTPIAGIVMRLRYAFYDLPDALYQTDARQDRMEITFDINYAFPEKSNLGKLSLDGLTIQLRLAYNDYETDYDFDAYKQIHGYSFDSVTDDFVDARLYLNYQF